MDESEDKLDPEIEKIVREIIHTSRMEGIKEGGLFVIKTLKEAMEISGSSYVFPKWLDTAERELNKIMVK